MHPIPGHNLHPSAGGSRELESYLYGGKTFSRSITGEPRTTMRSPGEQGLGGIVEKSKKSWPTQKNSSLHAVYLV